MSNWLARGTGIHIGMHGSHFDRDQFGNLLKNVAPAAFLIPGIGPGMAAGLGGLGSAVGRGIQHGANLGDILKQGASGAAIAYGGGQGMQALRGAFAPSSAVQGASNAVPGTGAGASSAMPLRAVPNLLQGQPLSAGSQVSHALGSVGSFVHDNPLATSQGLSALAQIPGMGSENRLRNAQADQMQQQANESAYEFQQRKARDAAMEPLRRALMAQIGQSFTPGQSFGG